jgi:hypothetical protein
MTDEQTKPPTNADFFLKVAEEIDRNAASGFGGAFVVVPPKDCGNPLATVILDSRQDGTTFWVMLKAKCEAELQLLDQQQRSNQAGFLRR